ncbi:MAG: GNAT family N-acetyltransferase [Elusimicrobia bacterium]|jgi:ribosomal protein S18 acetylase RimI-like enzyme|nr:GNAT family N-acetyltransferase [Elusimicrobiota bacterium]
MLIRRARKEDYAAFAAIEAQYPGFPAWGPGGFETEEGNRNSVTLAAEAEGEVAGFINFWILRPQVQLNTLAVARAHARRGAARALVGKLCEYAAKNLCREIDLEVNERNSGAIALYAALGFEVVGRRPKFYNNTDAALLMRRTLPAKD